MNKRRVLWLVSWYPEPLAPYNGDFIQRHAYATAQFENVDLFFVSQAGWQVRVEQSSKEETSTGQLNETKVFFRFPRTGWALADRLLYNLAYYRTYRKLLRSYVREKGRPDLVHVHVPMKAGMLARWMRRLWGIPYLVSEHSSSYLPQTRDYFFDRSRRYQSAVRQIFLNALAVTNVSRFLGEEIRRLFELDAVQVIPNTVDTRLFYFKENHPPARFRFLHASTMDHPKNMPGILQAFDQLLALRNDWELRLLGPVSVHLATLIESAACRAHITCTGMVPYTQVAQEMQEASAFVLFSNYENFPCVIIEALCCGLPVISSKAGGAAEALDPGNGRVVPIGDTAALAHAASDMMNQYAGFDRPRIAAEAQKRYSYEAVGKAFSELYNKLLAVRD